MGLTVIVLAAGHGKRMKSKRPKVLHQLGGRSMVGHVLHAVKELAPDHVVVVVGHGREQVTDHLGAIAPDVRVVVQEEQLGTGHAARVGLDAVPTEDGDVLVLTADTPLLRGETLAWFVERHREDKRSVSILTAEVPSSFGYGRIVRAPGGGDVWAIVEEKDATDDQREIREINSGILAFDAAFLADALPKLTNDNAAGEYYLTGLVGLARENGLPTGGFLIDDYWETEGANDRLQLARLGKELNRRIVEGWMLEGVSVVDPDATWIDADAELAPDVTLLPGTQILGATKVGEDALIGPFTSLVDCEVGVGAHVFNTRATLAVIGDHAEVGPFAHLRANTRLDAHGKIGEFVGTKNAHIGEGAKVPHLSYIGDAEIGEGSNIGAGTITANYDGTNKHRTTIGKNVKSGSNVTFVAPVTVGDGAMTGAGSTIREDVPADALAVSAGPQRVIDGHAAKKRAAAVEESRP